MERRRGGVAGPQEARIVEHEGGGQQALRQHILAAIEIVEQGRDECGALGEPCLQIGEFGGGDRQRDGVAAPDAVGVLIRLRARARGVRQDAADALILKGLVEAPLPASKTV